MSRLSGIFVSLTTASDSWAGTDDPLYLGVVGTVGGREFGLDVGNFNDFEKGTIVTYSIGPDAKIFGGRQPRDGDASLAETLICQPNVTHVYVRKFERGSEASDDAWRLRDMFVYLIADGEPTRVFTGTGPTTLSRPQGLTVWLAEGSHSGGYLDARIPVNGVASCRG